MDEYEIDRFCNYIQPPDTIVSDYNHLFVVLKTGAEETGSGFIATYTQHIRVDIANVSDGEMMGFVCLFVCFSFLQRINLRLIGCNWESLNTYNHAQFKLLYLAVEENGDT